MACATRWAEADRPAGGGEEPTLRLGEPERGAGGGHDEVAGEHELEPAGEGRALHRGDDRLRVVAPGDAAEARPSSSSIAAALPDATALRSAPAQKIGPVPVMTTVQTSSSASIVVEGRLDGQRELGAHRVARFGAVEPQDLDPTLAVPVPGSRAHSSSVVCAGREATQATVGLVAADRDALDAAGLRAEVARRPRARVTRLSQKPRSPACQW